MNAPPIESEKIRAYLLGNVRPDDSDDIESAYFASEAALMDVSDVEQELIEDYLAGRLDVATRAVFESRYLTTPPHRRRVALIRDLQGRSGPRRRTLPYWPLGLAAAILVVAALGVVAFRHPREADERAAGTPAGGSAAPSRAQAATVAITLPAVTLRGEGELPTVRMNGDETGVTLRMERGDAEAPPPYQVTVSTVEGSQIWKGEAIADGARPGAPEEPGAPLIASVTIPASSLAGGDYIVVLASGGPGGSEVQRYSFRLVRR